ncbi:MAG: hypothetical protein GXP47_12185, partial [Acidobacteria bacterium]|nr:hypothetical protein [Acidobacteriota bacterium]
MADTDDLGNEDGLTIAPRDAFRKKPTHPQTQMPSPPRALDERPHLGGNLDEDVARTMAEESGVQLAALEQENVVLERKARSVLSGIMDRLLGSKPQRHFQNWFHSLFYALVRLVLKLEFKGYQSDGRAGAPSPGYAARFERYLKARKALCGTPSDQMICPSEPG